MLRPTRHNKFRASGSFPPGMRRAQEGECIQKRLCDARTAEREREEKARKEKISNPGAAWDPMMSVANAISVSHRC